MFEDIPAIDLAYAAGFVDGDGCFSYAGHKKTSKKTGLIKKKNYPKINVTNADVGIIFWFHFAFGGTVCSNKPSCPKSKPTWSWNLHGKKAFAFAAAIHPYLRIKQMQAEVFFAWEAIGPYKSETKNYADVEPAVILLLEELHWLNHKGSSDRGPQPILGVVEAEIFENAIARG